MGWDNSPRPAVRPKMNGAPRRLLVIDDEQSICEFVKRVAESEGYEVAVATSDEQFQDSYDRFKPSAILLDLVMPKVDGIALLGALAEKHCRAQLVIMSGQHPELLKSGSRLGSGYNLDVRGTLHKPFGVPELQSALHWLE
jgi:DNA-binding response OmpR family regulator